MKSILFLLMCAAPMAAAERQSKAKLLCHKWQQVGIKNFGREYRAIDKAMGEVITFNADGSYTEDLDGGNHIKGKWKFGRDSVKLAFAITHMNGEPVTDVSLADAKLTDSIILLNNDTLVYGRLARYGRDKVYGHEDSYFVRVE